MHRHDSPPDGTRDADGGSHVDPERHGYGGFGHTGQSDIAERRPDPDQRIRDDVRRLLTDADLDAAEIEVTVQDGEVVLEGTVEDRWAKREAEDVACQARGVTGVHNRLQTSARGDRAR